MVHISKIAGYGPSAHILHCSRVQSCDKSPCKSWICLTCGVVRRRFDGSDLLWHGVSLGVWNMEPARWRACERSPSRTTCTSRDVWNKVAWIKPRSGMPSRGVRVGGGGGTAADPDPMEESRPESRTNRFLFLRLATDGGGGERARQRCARGRSQLHKFLDRVARPITTGLHVRSTKHRRCQRISDQAVVEMTDRLPGVWGVLIPYQLPLVPRRHTSGSLE